MSRWVKEKEIHEGKKPREKPFGLPYQNHIDNVEKRQKDLAIERAKINDKKHKPTKEIHPERKTIFWMDYDMK